MQGRQNTSGDRLQHRMQRLMFPEGCGYRSETGGLMECLRDLGVKQIRDYHRSYYRPDNLCLVITGKIDHARLLRALVPVEERIIRKGPLPPIRRPWVTSPQPPPLVKSVDEVVQFPDEDESMGEVMFAWMGPKDYLELKAIDVLNTYLSDSAVSVLQREFVEIEEPLCTDIDFHMTEQLRVILTLNFSNVPAENLEEIKPKFLRVLDRVCKQGFDMDRMRTVINREKLKVYETTMGDENFLYGDPNGEDLERSVQDLKYLEAVAQFTNEQWIERLRKYYVTPAHICLLGKPSAKFAKELLREETERTEAQRERLGKEKLKELERKLEEVKKKNDVKVPKEIMGTYFCIYDWISVCLWSVRRKFAHVSKRISTSIAESFPIPSASSISFIPVVTARNQPVEHMNEVQDHVNKDDVSIPYFIQFDPSPSITTDINSAFVTLSLIITTTALPPHLRAYMSVFLDSFFNLPLDKPDGTQISYEEVVRQLNEDTIQFNASLGSGSGFRELVLISMKVEAAKYKKAIKWLEDLLWNTEFATERLVFPCLLSHLTVIYEVGMSDVRFLFDRLKIAASKILNDIPQAKRDDDWRRVARAPVRPEQVQLCRHQRALSGAVPARAAEEDRRAAGEGRGGPE
ncbi:Metalloenzyme, LuxS/M16 peptidase-like protein [Jimgerdemannia flammicorona]|uniref:Metalloenzyme, LuxS/M16 peptidase-like protein n=1 Tax=Jimgerdemannia flammicorona TaxID=994334 RepID=A0A433DCS6_9FUNG|nr:Metalloenzyme, LuxS/M16 peptidase-like protein [Jimgerdemannia flammicorona]